MSVNAFKNKVTKHLKGERQNVLEELATPNLTERDSDNLRGQIVAIDLVIEAFKGDFYENQME